MTETPDVDRVERIASDLLAAWFNAWCQIPEQIGCRVPSNQAVAKCVELALRLCVHIDASRAGVDVALADPLRNS